MTVKKFLAAAASAALMGAMFAPSVFAADLEISGNGADSTNKIYVTSSCVVDVYQGNKTSATTGVTAYSATGGNTAEDNTGGDTTIDTGDATTTVAVVVTGGDNSAKPPSCCECAKPASDITIKGNGADSYNKVKEVSSAVTLVTQKTKTKATTGITAKAKTGKNKAKGNTGGSTEVKTGDAETTVDVLVSGGSNNLP